MNPIVQYVLEVVVLPALIAVAAFSPFLFPPLRRRAWRVEAAVGTVFALTFLLSFITELDHRAVLRQVVAIEGDDAPFERWHRLGLVALLLIPAAWMLSFVRRKSSTSRGMMSTLGYALLAAILCGAFVTFPGSSPLVQIAQGVLILASIFGWLLTNQAVLWNAWVVFGVLALFMRETGFTPTSVPPAPCRA